MKFDIISGSLPLKCIKGQGHPGDLVLLFTLAAGSWRGTSDPIDISVQFREQGPKGTCPYLFNDVRQMTRPFVDFSAGDSAQVIQRK